MKGKYLYFATASLFGVLCSLQAFFPFLFLTIVYIFTLFLYKRFSIRQLASMIVIFILFLVSARIASDHNKTSVPPEKSLFYLNFIDDPTIDGDQLQIIALDLQFHEKFLLNYKIKSEKEKSQLETEDFYGLLCKVSGALAKPPQAKNENAFNYREYLRNKQIFWVLTSTEMPLQQCIQEKLNGWRKLKQFRYHEIKFLQDHFPREAAGLSAALIYGDRSLMKPEIISAYQQIGLTHLLAISGLHVTLLLGTIFFIGIRLGVPREGMTNLMFIILPVYAILTGSSPSVVRSVLMIFLVIASIKWRKTLKLLPIDAITLAFCLFLLVRPQIIYDVGFQLSFSVSVAVILSAPLILNHYQHSFSRLLAVSIIAQLAAFPFALYHFFTVSLVGILANLIFVPLYSYVFLPGVYLLVFLQMIFHSVPLPLMSLFSFTIRLSEHLAKILSGLRLGSLIPGRPGMLFLAFYVIVVLAIFLVWENKLIPKRKLIISALCICLLTFQNGWNKLSPFGEVTMIDVGQGDSIFIHLPFGQGNYLIDTGGSLSFPEAKWKQRAQRFEVGKDVVVPFLKGKGITNIDKLVLTHGDMDHIGGAFALIKELKINQILIPSIAETSASEEAIIKEAHKRGIEVLHVYAGEQWKIGSNLFRILSPEKGFSGDRNRGSIVVFAQVGGLNWFFGGDLDQEGEETVLKEYQWLSIDVLKVGHHGSKTSSSNHFLNRLKPKVALISVGEKNRFGHPNEEVIERLKKLYTKIYRTDRQGEITYRFYHNTGTFSAFLP